MLADGTKSGPGNQKTSDSKDEEVVIPSNHRTRRSKRLMRQQCIDDQKNMSRIVNLVAIETSTVPEVVVDPKGKLSHGLAAANQHL